MTVTLLQLLSQYLFEGGILFGLFLLLFFVVLLWVARVPVVVQVILLGPLIIGLCLSGFLPSYLFIFPWLVIAGLWVFMLWHAFGSTRR